jgi:hypothetical protein
MVTRLPPDTRQEVDLIAGLGPESLLWLSGGAIVAWMILRSPHLPVALRVALVVVILAVTAVLTWGRYPLGDGGDRVTVWIGRAVRFWASDRTPRGPYAADPPPAPARSSSRKEVVSHGSLPSRD